MARRGDDWASRRGIAPSSSEQVAPWVRIRADLETRYLLGFDLSRRWERPDADDPRNVAIFLRQASAVIDADLVRAVRAAGYGLCASEVDALRRIAVKPSANTNLAEYLRLTPTRVSRIVTALERQGLVECSDTHRDLRRRWTVATDDGHDLVAELDRSMDQLARLWLEDLDETAHPAAIGFLALLAGLD